MVATSHDVMPDIELYQPTDEANALALANTLGSDGWLPRWRPGYLRLAKGPQQGGRRHDRIDSDRCLERHSGDR